MRHSEKIASQPNIQPGDETSPARVWATLQASLKRNMRGSIKEVAIKSLINIRHHTTGWCNVCGSRTIFICIDPSSLRGNMFCIFCQSLARKRHVASAIIREMALDIKSIGDIMKKGMNLKVYSTDVNDSFHKILSGYEGFLCSVFLPDIKAGTQLARRVFCQDIERLTFDDDSFDLVITEDVFEHVRNYENGLKEVHRVLREGGRHIFTIPFWFDRPTVTRIDTSGKEDVDVLPREYHGGPIHGQCLVYRDFGIDLFGYMKSLGFETKVDFSTYADRKFGIYDSYVFISKKNQKVD
jgi:SAM-dependent methyltransferase